MRNLNAKQVRLHPPISDTVPHARVGTSHNRAATAAGVAVSKSMRFEALETRSRMPPLPAILCDILIGCLRAYRLRGW
jgi:hypothetical protein